MPITLYKKISIPNAFAAARTIKASVMRQPAPRSRPKNFCKIFAMMSRKDHEHIAPVVRKNSDILIVTTNNDNKALDPETLKKETSADYSFYNLKDALEKSKELAEKDDTILIFGSLYLVGEILKIIK